MNEKRLNRRDFAILTSLCLFCLILAAALTRGKYLYGSTLDWHSQHVILPDYFRGLFYETGELFPSLAPNLGGGQNIYYFASYGLLSPVILLSYLLPFVPMAAYLQAVSILSVLLTLILFYLWARRRFDRRISGILAFLFAFSGPLLLHSHRHLMFMIYLPFMMAALYAADRFFDRGRKAGLVIFSALIIFTSYFFSVAALVALTVWGIYRFMEKRAAGNRGKLLPDLLKTGGTFAGLMLTAVLIAAVLLIPTARMLLGGRDSEVGSGIGWRDLLPTVDLQSLTFGSYSLGLSSLVILSVIDQLISGRRVNRYLAGVFAAFLTCPALIWLLNGTQYLDGKVMIPFIPLALILMGDTLVRLLSGQVRPLTLILFGALSAVGILLDFMDIHELGYALDSLFVLLFAGICLICAKWRQRIPDILQKGAIFLVLTVPAATCLGINFGDELVPISQWQTETDADLYALFDDLEKLDPGLYRTGVNVDASEMPNFVYAPRHYSDTLYSSLYSQSFNRFRFEEMCGENSYRNRAIQSRIKNRFFNLYMGDRYWIVPTGGYVPDGYSEIAVRGDYHLYRTDDALPVGYVSTRLMGREEYEGLSYPDNVEALMAYTVVERDLPDTGFVSSLREIPLDGIFDDCPLLKKDGSRYLYSPKDEVESRKYSYTLPKEYAGQPILLRFTVDNTVGDSSSDVKIWVNGVANKLTAAGWRYHNHNESFEYQLSLWGDDSRELIFTLPDGEYAIRDVRAWRIDPALLTDLSAGVDAFVPDMERTAGDTIVGRVNASADGYFNLSFVYEEGYTVLVDGEPVIPERVDGSFLGFPISAGEHTVEIRYTAPGLAAGKALSAVGIALLAGFALWDVCAIRREKRKNG